MSQLDLRSIRMDIAVTRRSTLTLRWTLTEQDGTPIDLTGATVTMTVRETPAESSPLIFSEPGAHESPSEGKTIIERTDEEMAIGIDGETTNYWYELRLVEADGAARVVFGGIFQIAPTSAPAS